MSLKFFEKNGDIFMEVMPVKALFHSDMVHDVITHGRQFVVNMNTGDLTIHTPSKLINKIDHRPRYKPAGLKTIVISNEIDVAVVQLRDQYDVGRGYGKLYYGANNSRVAISSKNNWSDFILEVRKVYAKGWK
jgi:hypothetical protein